MFKQYAAFPAAKLYSGQGLDPKLLALVEPFSNGYRAAVRAGVREGEEVLVIGGGTIGIAAALSAMHFGAEVTVCDISSEKLEMAEWFGIHHTVLNGGSVPLAKMAGNKRTETASTW